MLSPQASNHEETEVWRGASNLPWEAQQESQLRSQVIATVGCDSAPEAEVGGVFVKLRPAWSTECPRSAKATYWT